VAAAPRTAPARRYAGHRFTTAQMVELDGTARRRRGVPRIQDRSRVGVSGTAVDNQLSQRSRRLRVLQAGRHPTKTIHRYGLEWRQRAFVALASGSMRRSFPVAAHQR
jgi:hypothetical protein